MPADTRYRPNIKVTTKEIPFVAEINRADPEHEAKKRREVSYSFSNGRKFHENPAKSGIYSED